MDPRPARYLLQHGKPVRKILDRLLTGAHRAGFLVLPRRSAGAASLSTEPEDTPALHYGSVTAGTSVERRAWRFDLEHRDYPRGLVALQIAQLHYPGARPMHALELSVDLHQGPPLLLERVLALVELQPGFVPARLDDAERAALAACTDERTARTLPGAHLALESHWQDLGLAHLKALTALLQRYEPRAWESLEPEGVHQMRVSARRLREALRAFGPVLPAPEAERLAGEVRWLGGVLGAVRDLDVQLARLRCFEASPDSEPNPALDAYCRHLQKRQRRAHRALVTALADPRYRALLHDLQELVTVSLAQHQAAAGPSIGDAGSDTLHRLLKRVLRSGRKALARCDGPHLHRARIDAKRLRYFLEYVAPFGGKQLTTGIAALNRLQDILGEHQDASVAHDDLVRYRAGSSLPGRDRRRLGRLIDAEARRIAAARAAFRDEWPEFVASSRKLVLC